MKLFEIKNKTPQWMLVESKNTHIEHLEDLVFINGYDGAQTALDYVESIRQMLATGTGLSSKISVKWDGSPAIICGTDPDDGKFFVGTKAVFNKKMPKLCKSEKDIENHYPEQPEIVQKLKCALKYLPKLDIGGVLQGDLLFTRDSMNVVEMDGVDCFVFTPNTITYAVPVDSHLGTIIEKAEIGIIFHTYYEGRTIEDMKAHYGANISGLKKNSDVWFDDASYKDYTGIASLSPRENTKIQKFMASTLGTMEKLGKSRFDLVLTDKEFCKMVKPFINHMIRHGLQMKNPTVFLKDFTSFYNEYHMKDIQDLGKIAAQNRLTKIKQREDWIADNSNTLLGILSVYKRLIELKHLILDKLNTVEGIGAFQKTDDGYKVTNQEGFVAIGHEGGAIKLVDRLEFSRANFIKNSH